MNFSQMITAVDAHACGEPGRVITGGVLDVPGATMFEKKVYLETHADHLRQRMLREPRGYPALCCNVILPPTNPAADAGFVIMEQTEYPPMSGSNTICVVTVLIETGMVKAVEPVTNLTLETPAGLIQVEAQVTSGKVTQVKFRNVPAFAVHLDAAVEVTGIGTVTVDVAYGGMFYVIADAQALGFRLIPEEGREIARVAELVKAAAIEQLATPIHPDNPAIRGVSITQLSGPPSRPGVHARNGVVVSTGKGTGVLDRSPCGTGTCAKMAVLHAKGELGLHREFIHEGILGTTFTGKLIGSGQTGPYASVTPELAGQAWITGIAQYVLDPTDPFPEGYTVGDLWG